jgi:Cu+-exporting ATPase
MTTVREHVDLVVTGMTCASCAVHVERSLNGLPSVRASVNYATEKAAVEFDPARVTPDDLLGAVGAAGYGAVLPRDVPNGDGLSGEDESATRNLRRRLLISGALALPVLLLSMIPALQFSGWEWVAFALATPVATWGAWPFHRAAWVNLRHRATTMDTLVSLGVLAAYGWSLYALLSGGAGGSDMAMGTSTSGADQPQLYLEVASVVTVFLLAGRYFEARAKRRAGAALRALGELGAKEVAVLRGGDERRMSIAELVVGDRFVVRPGEKLATDGVVEEGSSAIDAALLTGESVPVEVGPGDAVTGATINVGGRLVVRATRVGADTQLAQMARLVEAAQRGKAPVQRLADRVSSVFVPVVLVISLATLVGWLLITGDTTAAFTAAVAVLIIACPCALGLATPTALLVGTGRGAQLGILIKGPEVLESTRAVDTIVLDKTGTVTTGTMALVDVVTAADAERAEVLRLVGALEGASEHPIARAIAAAAPDEVGPLPAVEAFSSRPGLGAEGVVEGHLVVVGRPSLLSDRALVIPVELDAARVAAEARGHTVVAAAWDGEVRALLVLADALKPTSAAAVRGLTDLGLDPVLLTGDNERTAAAVGEAVGITAVTSEVLPEQKLDAIRTLQRGGKVVAMVGDGVNDAAALAQADLGIAMGTGTDVAIEASDLTLVRGDLRAAVDAIRLSRRTLATIKGNLFWAFAYNVAAIPLAALGFLNPVVAGAAMAFSSVFVVSNSLRLRGFRPLAAAA